MLVSQEFYSFMAFMIFLFLTVNLTNKMENREEQTGGEGDLL